jgi:hypothetical protein
VKTSGNVCAIVDERSQTTHKSGKQSSQRSKMITLRRATFAVGGRARSETFADHARADGANVFLRVTCGWAASEVDRL